MWLTKFESVLMWLGMADRENKRIEQSKKILVKDRKI